MWSFRRGYQLWVFTNHQHQKVSGLIQNYFVLYPASGENVFVLAKPSRGRWSIPTSKVNYTTSSAILSSFDNLAKHPFEACHCDGNEVCGRGRGGRNGGDEMVPMRKAKIHLSYIYIIYISNESSNIAQKLLTKHSAGNWLKLQWGF